eukprot:scaffold5025_cov145-Amphora_coffeaeformis.AAC.2
MGGYSTTTRSLGQRRRRLILSVMADTSAGKDASNPMVVSKFLHSQGNTCTDSVDDMAMPFLLLLLLASTLPVAVVVVVPASGCVVLRTWTLAMASPGTTPACWALPLTADTMVIP